jgi:hypothetical protein
MRFLLKLKYFGSLVWFSHGLINYQDTKAKCRHLKKLTYIKGLCGRSLSEFIDLEIHSVMLVFSTQLCELLPLYPSLWFNDPPSPLSCVKVWLEGGEGC